MRVEPRVVVFTAVIGAGATATMVFLAVTLPQEGFLLLLFPSFFLWVLIPFMVLRLWRRFKGQTEEG